MAGRRLSFRARGTALAAIAAASSLVVAMPWVAPTVAGASASPLSALPQSAGGCNQSICINVEGSGTKVTRWSTSATLPTTMCSFADYWANGVVVDVGTLKCASAGSSVSSYWPEPGNFAVGTQVCNTWTGIAGRPCETIE